MNIIVLVLSLTFSTVLATAGEKRKSVNILF